MPQSMHALSVLEDIGEDGVVGRFQLLEVCRMVVEELEGMAWREPERNSDRKRRVLYNSIRENRKRCSYFFFFCFRQLVFMDSGVLNGLQASKW